MAQLRRRVRDAVVVRLAFLIEALQPSRSHEVEQAVVEYEGPTQTADCEVLAVVAHWRGPSAPAPTASDPAVACLRALVSLKVRRLQIVLVTDDIAGTEALVALLGDTGGAEIRIEHWRPRGLRRHGYNLPWHHKVIFRRALDDQRLTHLLYLEDDIAFTTANFGYWLAARTALASEGLLPALVRFEQFDDRRMLVDQTRSGQHEEAGVSLSGEEFGAASVHRSLRPYKACVLLDRRLATAHLTASPFRSPLRSLIVRWDLRERAAAGETFAAPDSPLRGVLSPVAVRAPIRDAVLLEVQDDGSSHLPEGALIEHLRPTYSRDPLSRHGTIAVEDF